MIHADRLGLRRKTSVQSAIELLCFILIYRNAFALCTALLKGKETEEELRTIKVAELKAL